MIQPMHPSPDTTPAAPKKRRGKGNAAAKRAGAAAAKAAVSVDARADGGSAPVPGLVPFAGGGLDILIPDDGAGEPQEIADGVSVNAATGTVTIESEDGSVTVDPTGASAWQKPEAGDEGHGENLAHRIEPNELARIAEELIDAIGADKRDRSEWEQMRAKAIELLGMKLDDPKPDVSASGAGLSISVVRDPVLLEAVERFRANAFAEMCPARGPVKVVNWGAETAATDDLARSLQKDLNYYLTTIASEYYPDTHYMLWWTGLASGTFKKVYRCPLRRRPVSEYVDGTHLIVPSNATDLKNAGRVTHEIPMRRAVMKRMQILDVYRRIDLADPMPANTSVVDAKKAAVEGKVAQPQRIEDQEYTLYESYCELDIAGFEHAEDGKITGLPLPYRVTIDAGSRQVLEVRRNWEEEDEDYTADIPFVLWPYSTGLSRIYGSGLGQMGGNITAALTALLRICIDNGMFANFPGFLYSEDMGGGAAGRQMTNHFRVPPGGGAGIKTGGAPIGNVVMELPYKDVSQAVVALIEQTRGVAQRLMGTAEVPVGEGRQDAPVGTTLALIEQATKILSAVHKMLHTAQGEEFRLLLKLFRDDPEALWRGNRRPALGMGKTDADKAARVAKFKQALDEYLIVPMADPNVPSEMHRILKAMGLKQLTAGNPAYDQVAVDRRVAQVLQIDDFDTLISKAPQQPPPEMMAAMAALQLKVAELEERRAKSAGDLDIKKMQAILKAISEDKDRKSRESIEAMKIAAGAAASADAADGAAAQGAAGTDAALDPARMAKEAADVHLAARKIDLDEIKIAIDARERQADRAARQSEKALDIAERLATHPASDAIVDEQLAQMAPFLTPQGGGAAPMGGGGPVMADDGGGGPDGDADGDLAETLALAMQIAQAVRAMDRPAIPPPVGHGFAPPFVGGMQ